MVLKCRSHQQVGWGSQLWRRSSATRSQGREMSGCELSGRYADICWDARGTDQDKQELQRVRTTWSSSGPTIFEDTVADWQQRKTSTQTSMTPLTARYVWPPRRMR